MATDAPGSERNQCTQQDDGLPCPVDCPVHGVVAPVDADPWNLARFIEAQDDDVYERALQELRAGHKRTHWMWFVFPQLRGLSPSPSPMNDRFALRSRAEARAYGLHPVLGARLVEATEAHLTNGGGSLHAVLGSDDVKFRSCATLFAQCLPEVEIFSRGLEVLCDNKPDGATLELLAKDMA